MARKNAVRTVIQLNCTGDYPYTYHTQKNRQKTPGRIELTKYCPRCRSRQVFRESRR